MSEVRRLFESFSKPNKGEWTAAASSEINGGDPSENLKWKTEDELDFGPFYSEDDIKDLVYLQQFQLNGIIPEAEPHIWSNMPPVTVTEAKKANEIALSHLQQEADGITFILPSGFSDYNTLLNHISWEHCAVSFVGDARAAEALKQFLASGKFNIAALTGGFFSRESVSHDSKLASTSKFRLNGIVIEHSTPVNEIEIALTLGTSAINRMIEAGLDTKSAFKQVAFSVPVSAHLLVEISKLKALRLLWYQVAQAFGVTDYKPSDLYVQGRSEPFIEEKFQPHGNLLKSTVAAMAAISGGANALTIQPEDEQHSMMSRIARNVSVILKLESQLGKVNDPFAGAYGIEILTDKIAKEAWSKFQSQQ